MQLGVLARSRNLHAAAFAAAPSVDLRLHHYACCAFGKQLARYIVCLFQRVGYLALGHSNAILRQDFLRLILMNFQIISRQTAVVFLRMGTARLAFFRRGAPLWCGTQILSPRLEPPQTPPASPSHHAAVNVPAQRRITIMGYGLDQRYP